MSRLLESRRQDRMKEINLKVSSQRRKEEKKIRATRGRARAVKSPKMICYRLLPDGYGATEQKVGDFVTVLLRQLTSVSQFRYCRCWTRA